MRFPSKCRVEVPALMVSNVSTVNRIAGKAVPAEFFHVIRWNGARTKNVLSTGLPAVWHLAVKPKTVVWHPVKSRVKVPVVPPALIVPLVMSMDSNVHTGSTGIVSELPPAVPVKNVEVSKWISSAEATAGKMISARQVAAKRPVGRSSSSQIPLSFGIRSVDPRLPTCGWTPLIQQMCPPDQRP